jgi:subtilase family serine protease
MIKKRSLLVIMMLVIVILAFISISSSHSIAQVMNQDSPIPVKAHFVSRASSDLLIQGSIHFHLRNGLELENLIAQQQDSQSKNYHKWLTPQEFGYRFGLENEKYKAVLSWLENNGIKVTNEWVNQLSIEFQAPASQVEKIFSVEMNKYEMSGVHYYSNDRSPQVPTDFISEIAQVRLHNFPKYHSTIRYPNQSRIAPNFNNGTASLSLGPQDFYKVYNASALFNDGIDGTGQTIGIVADSDFDVKDVNSFRSTFKLPQLDIEKIALGPIRVSGARDEALLDIEIASAVAPMAKVQVAIVDQNVTDFNDAIRYFVNNSPQTKVINISFGLCERDDGISDEEVLDALFKQASAQGQSVFVSSGDDGANDCGDGTGRQVNALASSPFVTAVGGTSLDPGFDTNGNATTYKGEEVWDGSGGGFSSLFSKPTYQLTSDIPSGSGRTVPDVALMADPNTPGWAYFAGGRLSIVGGTSASTPAWVGIFALANQLSKDSGLGAVNSRIYQLGSLQQKGGKKVFNDITTGFNSNHNVQGYGAKVGYDLATGWGSPSVNDFVRSFVALPSDESGLTLISPNGGEFSDIDKTIKVNWLVSDKLSAKITSQDILFSDDAGNSFKPVATNLNKQTRSFTFDASQIVSTTARFRIVVHTTDNVDVVDSSSNNVNLNTALRIDSAFYSTKDKGFLVFGTGLNTSAQLIVNGITINKPAKAVDRQTIFFKGGIKKFGLRSGDNFVNVIVGGVKSASYKIIL